MIGPGRTPMPAAKGVGENFDHQASAFHHIAFCSYCPHYTQTGSAKRRWVVKPLLFSSEGTSRQAEGGAAKPGCRSVNCRKLQSSSLA
jgi:hypothetical protein